MNEPTFFKPHALLKAPIVRESRLIRDLTMPERDWSVFNEPTYMRRARQEQTNERRCD
jgi:hypothetical protein